QKVDWVFNFSSVTGKKNIGVILLQHELVWVEIKKDMQVIDKLKPDVWGSIEKLEPGEYKIMITNDNALVSEKEFVIYDSIEEQDD
ncbi:MAG TPA: hypothetical protein VF857_06680, partial [Spirochaetota bacterium]